MTKADVVLIGPGLGENSKAEVVFQMVLEHISEHQILIIDGSALNLLAKAKPITVKSHSFWKMTVKSCDIITLSRHSH